MARFLLSLCLVWWAIPAWAQSSDKLMERFLDGFGGREALDAVENVRFIGFLHFESGRSIPFMLFYAQPQMSRLVLQFPEWQQLELTRLGEAWEGTVSPRGTDVTQLEGAKAQAMLAEAFPLGSLVAYLQKRYLPRSIMVEGASGNDTLVRLAHGDGVFSEHRLAEDGSVRQIAVVTVYEEEFPDRFEVLPLEFTEVAGVRWPTELENRMNGEFVSRLQIVDVAVNLALPGETFALPAQ
ncbi:MAG: hypothetical protein Q7P63_06160 [Verrucomicrobiota bacterium JB022]|nr:hypothetical protein [Verrucomicrobiota bacterium JB022]